MPASHLPAGSTLAVLSPCANGSAIALSEHLVYVQH